MNYINKFSYLILPLALTYAACSESSDPMQEDPAVLEDSLERACDDSDLTRDCVELADNTLRIGREKKWGILESRREGNTLSLKLSATSRLREELKVGTRLVRWRRDRRPVMVSVQQMRWDNDNRVVLEIEKIGLKDAFRKGRIRTNFSLQKAADTAEQDGSISGIGSSSQPLFLGVADCSAEIANTMIAGANINVAISRCSFGFTPEINLIISWGGLLPDFVEFTGTGTLTAELEAIISASAAIGASGESKLLTLARIPVPVFPILTVGVDLFAGYDFGISGEVEVKAGFDYSGTITSGFVWNKGDRVRSIFAKEKNFTVSPPVVNFDGHAHAKVYLKPHLTLSALDVVSGYVSVEAYANLVIDADLQATPLANGGSDINGRVCYDLAAGLRPGLGVQGLFGLFSADLELRGVEWSLLDDCVDLSEVSACTESDECIVDTDCQGGLSPVCQIPVCTSDCSCSRVVVEDCCITDGDCDDGDDASTDVCTNNRCYSLTPAEIGLFLCNDNSDCDDGLAATLDVCSPAPAPFQLERTCKHITVSQEELDAVNVTVLCGSDAQCDDGDPDTEDTCHINSCINVPISTDPCDSMNCNDYNGSTEDYCISGSCRHLPR